ncbi:hypothetical protein QFC21_004640 [Naganishia friedmannii]|uniref:Uncharacterized protein n=1 Tax=Naganishia friedmannii TaxID=89922 RepID=A0ACC2VFJ3_9TREE|nr:hypothetical protein QFC21_004640 [Naganishia friedmannii]
MSILDRSRPQETNAQTTIEPNSFYGKIRTLYADKVLYTQLEQMRKQGSYDAFDMQWQEVYNVRRLTGARTRLDGIPPSLFWESDVGKWIEATCYFLANSPTQLEHADEFQEALEHLVGLIEKAQQPDGYLDIYFTVVDPEGRFKNFRDMHEMYNAGHLLEGALSHFQYTGSRRFLDVMIKYVECFMRHVGPKEGQLHGYPGHPELELAVLRLYAVTQDPKHLAFGQYLLAARGVKREDQGGNHYFVHEARVRDDALHYHTMDSLEDQSYNQSHLPLHDQNAILGHSVRALYLTTAAADLGGEFLDDAKRLFKDAVDSKMYVTGGFGSEPRFEGFSPIPHHLPQSTGEGGCYAETCASIAAMMTGERILSHGVDGKIRDTIELCLHNAVLGGGSLDGKAFSYANKMATYGDETAVRADWFEVCCCPPNLSRTLGMLGGYTWHVAVDEAQNVIKLEVYLFISATRTIDLPGGQKAHVTMQTEMPWTGKTEWIVEAPEGWTWDVKLPAPRYARNVKISTESTPITNGYTTITPTASSTFTMAFDMPVRLLSPHPDTHQDTITVSRGPIVYVAEGVDNEILERKYKHFENVGLDQSAVFDQHTIKIGGIPMVGLTSRDGALFALESPRQEAYNVVNERSPARQWRQLQNTLTLVPWFARANRGGSGHVRTSFARAEKRAVYANGNGH